MMPNSRRSPFALLRKSSRFGRSVSPRETAFTDMSVFDPVLDHRNTGNGSVSPSTGRPTASVKMGWCSNSLTGETSPVANESTSLKSRSSTSGASITSNNHNASFGLEGLAIVADDKVLLSLPSPAEVSPDSRRLPLRPTKQIARKPVPSASASVEPAVKPAKVFKAYSPMTQDDTTCDEAAAKIDIVDSYPVFRDSGSVFGPRYSTEPRNSSLSTASDTPALSDGSSSRNSSFSSTTSEQSEPRPSSASSMTYITGAPRASKRLSGSFNTLNGIFIVASPHRPTSRSPNRCLSKSCDVEAFQLPYLPTLFPESPSSYSSADLAEPTTKGSMLAPRTLDELGPEVDPITVKVTPKRRASFDSNAIRISCYDRVFYVH
ncbi:BZ3500_MvSof-1268-A1-R1_Chr2-1g04531 [Microbotryum saponariae]|uniref:BZ3500_MvSof-1268-A1-R1_Chr2-1g04531 protein n=1 Tax=Microbotryum saponariae TaxID=289078 RepID=A0A2X0KZV8_9BASI|nr:BZ3500_MvSof-1268-A1-R1_Chr2-1g04531 [Microbotryum saponariae]SCZ91941.1 BZ3501_MvSof-1269-A2-R1_Chr2-1g04187 [Microbotryum saponariae]